MEIPENKFFGNALNYLKECLNQYNDLNKINHQLNNTCGIIDFFSNEDDLSEINYLIKNTSTTNLLRDKSEFGDF